MKQFDRLFDISGLSLDRLRTFLRVVEAGNLSNAAQGDATKQSQFSRQIKELESFFGVALTRRVGRRIEITDEGHRLALVIRRHFNELDDFRKVMAGRSVSVRIGSQGSVINWLLVPRLDGIHKALGNAIIELEQLRTADVVRAVADGRLDFGVVREDAVYTEIKRWRLGVVGYALFAANRFWKDCSTVQEVIQRAPVVDLLPGGQFPTRWQQWLDNEKLAARVPTRVSSFTDAARVVQDGHAAGVLPDLALVDFDRTKFKHLSIAGLKPRTLVMIANTRSIERIGIPPKAADRLVQQIKLP